MERFTETDCSKCGVPVNVDLDPQGDLVRYDDAQRALDAEREKVKELVANQAEYEKCTDEQITALNQGCLDYEKQIATLQAQLADRDAMILQMGEQAAVLAKENMAVKAQLRQVREALEAIRKGRNVIEINQAWAKLDATLAAQDAGAKLPAWVNEAMRLAPTQTNPPHPTEERS